MLPFNMGVGGSSGVDTGDIGHSLRCRSAASAYLSKTLSTPSNQAKWALSMWVKRGQLGAIQTLLGTGTVAGNMTALDFDANDRLQIYYPNTGANLNCLTNAVFRDPTSPIHIFVYFDSANGTTADRLQIWVNGVRQTFSTATYPSSACGFNGNVNHQIGRHPVTVTQSDLGASRIAFVDNPSGVTASSFAYLNTEINEWVSKSQSAVKAVVDAGGTNSFMLDFDDATSLTTLGYDKSSKGNNWTLNNFSLTAGTTYDHMLDVPGNSYATLNPLSLKGTMTLSSGNLVGTNGATHTAAKSSIAIPSGVPTYAETVITSTTSASVGCGFGITGQDDDGFYSSAGYYGFYASNTGVVYSNSSILFSGLGTFSAGTVLQVASDGAGKYWVGKDNVWYDSSGGTTGNPSTGANPTFTLSGQFFVRAHVYNNTTSVLFGQAPLHASATYQSSAGGYFRYTPPTGFKALCQRNLPDPAILNPEKHFDIRTRTGDGTSPKVLMSDLLFAPEFVWTKDRNTGYQHTLQDIVRGVGAGGKLYSSLTEAEGGANSVYGHISSFNSNGVTATVGASGFQHINANAVTYVDWLWKMGGAAVTNNNGSISSQVSANVLAGQSVVTYTGTGANATVGHGLASAPELIIAKSRSQTSQWVVYTKTTGASQYMYLNQTIAATTNTVVWQGVSPTTAVFSLGTGSDANTNGVTNVALCIHSVPGYSKVGSYTGNGSADGPYVECGFKPKYVLVKSSTAVDDWRIYDAARPGYNVIGGDLRANTSGAEATAAEIDFTSNGFKLRVTTTPNAAQTYIFYAAADVAGKFALGR